MNTLTKSAAANILKGIALDDNACDEDRINAISEIYASFSFDPDPTKEPAKTQKSEFEANNKACADGQEFVAWSPTELRWVMVRKV